LNYLHLLYHHRFSQLGLARNGCGLIVQGSLNANERQKKPRVIVVQDDEEA
jgi:hypothetical protein